MTTTDQNFTMWAGEDKDITVNLVDADGAAYGSLTGLTFAWKMATSENASSVLVTKTPTGTTDSITFSLADTDTQGLAPGVYYHECRVTDASFDEDVVFTGGMTIKGSITNP
jgi:hypothetical protein